MLRGAPAGEAASPKKRWIRQITVKQNVSGIPTQKSMARMRFGVTVALADHSAQLRDESANRRPALKE